MLNKASRSVLEGILPIQATLPYRMAIHALYASLRACNRYPGVYSRHVVYTHRISSLYKTSLHAYSSVSHVECILHVLRMYLYLHVHLHAHLDVYRVPRVSCYIGACILAC